MSDALTVLLAERERRRRQDLAAEAPRYDWYGPPCACPRAPDASCPDHPRARAKQRPPEGEWRIWYLEAGRGFGKSVSGARWVNHQVETGQARRIALVGPTAADVRDVMVGTPATGGVIGTSPPWCRAEFQPSKRRVIWRQNGKVTAMATCVSADEPDRLRGLNSDAAWVDEIATFKGPEAFDMLMLGLRIGSNPRCVITTTPRPLEWLRAIKRKAGTILTRGSTYENRANLHSSFFDTVIKKYEGTRLGRQELEAEDLEDTPGALWTTTLLDDLRVPAADLPEFHRIVVAVDPSVAENVAVTDESTAECGIMVGGAAYVQHPTLGLVLQNYLLADRTVKGHPSVWGAAVRNAYHEFGADTVVAEVNNGGALVATNIQALDPRVPVKMIHASRGKQTRAQPIATLYEQRRAWHVAGRDFSALENQLTGWVPGMKSPDRLDALVWLHTELHFGGGVISFGPHPFPDWQ